MIFYLTTLQAELHCLTAAKRDKQATKNALRKVAPTVSHVRRTCMQSLEQWRHIAALLFQLCYFYDEASQPDGI